MGTLSYYIIIGILQLFKYEEKFLKKSLDTKLDWFSSLHDALTSIWLITILFAFGIGGYWYWLGGVLSTIYIGVTVYEYIKGSIYFFRESHKEKYYTKYMVVDWEEVVRIIKEEKDEAEACTED